MYRITYDPKKDLDQRSGSDSSKRGGEELNLVHGDQRESSKKDFIMFPTGWNPKENALVRKKSY